MNGELNSQQIEYCNGMELLIGYIDRESTSAQSMTSRYITLLTLLNASPSQPLTNIRIHVKTPLGCNWYSRPGVVEDLWIDPRVQYRLPVFSLN